MIKTALTEVFIWKLSNKKKTTKNMFIFIFHVHNFWKREKKGNLQQMPF